MAFDAVHRLFPSVWRCVIVHYALQHGLAIDPFPLPPSSSTSTSLDKEFDLCLGLGISCGANPKKAIDIAVPPYCLMFELLAQDLACRREYYQSLGWQTSEQYMQYILGQSKEIAAISTCEELHRSPVTPWVLKIGSTPRFPLAYLLRTLA